MNFRSFFAFLLVVLLVSASATELSYKNAMKKTGSTLGVTCSTKWTSCDPNAKYPCCVWSCTKGYD